MKQVSGNLIDFDTEEDEGAWRHLRQRIRRLSRIHKQVRLPRRPGLNWLRARGY